MPDLPLLLDAETIPELTKDERWWSIYEESIPASERESRAVIFRGMEKGIGKALRARLKGKTVGMANIHVFHHPAAVFLSLLAIAPDQREHHIGSQLLEYAFATGCDMLAEKGIQPLGMVWEVDDPARGADDDEKNIRDRRISFYRQHRGELLACRYILPPLSPGNKPEPMRLMFRQVDGGQIPDAKTQKDLIWAIYFEKYRAINGLDEQMLNGLLQDLSR